MARIVDESKLKSIKKTLIDIIIKDGSTNASIAKVAKQAKVSVGYLYCHYDSKEDLINELYLDEFNELSKMLSSEITTNNDLKNVIHGFYTQIVERVRSQENSILFLLKMMTDYSMEITDEMRSKLINNISLFRQKFAEQIATNIESEQVYIQILGSILMFINLRKRNVLNKSSITQKDIDILTQVTINSLK